MSNQHHYLKLNPNSPVSATDLAVIVTSPELLKTWNDLNENALKANSKQPSIQLVNNIRLTAALIVQAEIVIASQNFELMRALNLYDQTLSSADIAQGFIKGIGNKLTDIARQTIAFTEPADMNLQHAQARTDALLSKPQQIADAIKTLWRDPDTIPKALQAELTDIRQRLAKSMIEEHPGITIGTELGATTTSIIAGTINPINKGKMITDVAQASMKKSMNWQNYATLIGGGLQPPPLKPMRDFSDDMHFVKPLTKYDRSRVIYAPKPSHKIVAEHLPDYGMTYLIKARDDREKYGSGTELFLSVIKTFHVNGIDISRIKSTWDQGALGTNWQQFMNARLAGETIEHASKHTFSGKMAAKLGLTSVDISKVDSAIETVENALQKNYMTLYPVFNRPNWGSNPAWNDYANSWVISQGRAGLTVISKINNSTRIKTTQAIPDQLLQQVEQLPAKQQKVVLEQLQENLSNTNSTVTNSAKKSTNPDIEF